MSLFARHLIALCLLCSSAFAAADFSGVPSGKYVLEKTHAYITFSYSHLGFSRPHLGFNAFDVTLGLDAKEPTKSSLEVTIDAGSIDSRLEEFNEHLNGPDFFNTEKFPEITFVGKEIKPAGDSKFEIVGDLSMMGQTHPATFVTTINKAAKHPMKGMDMVGVSAEATISRTQWGLGRYAPAVGDEVSIYVEVEMMREE